MSIWNKILLGLVFVTSLVFMYMAARTLQTHKTWREAASKQETRLKEINDQIKESLNATSEQRVIAEMGIEQLRQELFALLVDRGRVWNNCEPENVLAETGQVRVKTDFPDEDNLPGRHGIHEKTVLHVFEEGDVEAPLNDGGGRYLGEFRVTEVADGMVAMEPAMRMEKRELDRLSASRGPWSLYEVLPRDSHKVIRRMDKDYLRRVLPETVVNEYLYDGELMTKAKAEELGLEGKIVNEKRAEVADGEEGVYTRDLRDYRIAFNVFHRDRTLWHDRRESAELDKRYTEDAAADAAKQVAFRTSEVADLTAELGRFQRELAAVVAHEGAINGKLAELGRSATELVANNRAIASQIAQVQMEAQRRIDERTRRVAQREGEQ
ncbi:MAG: hypothetical protein U1E05_23005 [Patescibacteria group bacterium]|nr:hypothetical protein [Patescibacteria group bacterium]